MDDLSDVKFPAVDIDAHLKHLRLLTPSKDPARLAATAPKAKAVAPQFCEAAHAVANLIDAYRINGFSAGEAVQTIWDQFLDPIASVPVIKTDD